MKYLRPLGMMLIITWVVFIVLTWLDLITTSQMRMWSLVFWIRELDSWMTYVVVPGALVLWIFITGYVIGCWITMLLELKHDDLGDDLLAVALGTGLLSVLTYVFGLAGWLLSGVFAVLALCICASGYRLIGAGIRRIWGGLSGIPSWQWQDKVLLGVIIWYVFRTWLLVYNPATGWDECNSHLMAAKWYTREGVITFLPWVNFNNFPMGMECLLMLQFMGTDYPGAAIPYAFLLLTLCAIYQMGISVVADWTIQHFGGGWTGFDPAKTICKRTGALLACVIFLMVPAVTSYSQIVKPTMLLIFYAAMLAWAIITMPRKLTSYIVWGLLAGILISVKYTGILWAILMTACVLFYGNPWRPMDIWEKFMRSQRRGNPPSTHEPCDAIKKILCVDREYPSLIIKSTPNLTYAQDHIKWVLAYFGALLLVASPWLIRNIILFGSPVFPFFNDLIPAEWGMVAPALKAELAVKSSVMLELFHVENPWLAAWYNAMREDGPWAPHGRPGTSGPWILALIPLVAYCWRSIPVGLRWVFVASVAYVTAWWWGWRLNETRYMMPALPGFCVVVGLSVAKLLEEPCDT